MSKPDELDLTEFKESRLFVLDLDSLPEDELIKKYHAIKNEKFSFMESLIGHLIKRSSIDSTSQTLFQQYDNLLSNVLIRIKDDSKLTNYESGRNGSLSTNATTKTDEDSNSNSNQINGGQLNDSVIEASQSKGEIVLSSDDDSFDVNQIPCEEAGPSLNLNIIDDSDDDSNQFDYKRIYTNSSNKAKYLKRDYPFSERLFSVFYNVFGLKSFRPFQLECINSALLDEDLFILMPTGSGKSICYQLPATLKNGVTFVISPLRSLIQDQVQKLRMIGVEAETMCNDIRQSSEKQIYDDLRKDEPTLKLLYVTPEKISASVRLMKIMESLYERRLIARFVIDEAHCVSNWGHDFRPDYKRLSVLREKFTDVPLMALTATATPRVGTDIMRQLKMKNQVCFMQSFNRPNLRFEVKEKTKETINDIIKLIKSKFNGKSGIIYCLSRYESEQVAETLTKNGIRAMPYHAGIADKERFTIQEKWVVDKFQVICATIAFGMGIDKPDVRFVIHYSAPKSIEGYYQEAGRAGRDQKVSYCYLYYTYKDIKRLFKLFEENRGTEGWKVHIANLNSVAYFCTNNLECRKFQILKYFGERFNPADCSKQTASCDNCERRLEFEFKDYTAEAKLIIRSVEEVYKNANKKFPISHYIDVYKGSNNAKIKSEKHNALPMHGKGKSMVKDEMTMERFFRKLILEQLISEHAYLIQYDVVVTYLAPARKGQDLLNGKIKFEMPVLKANVQQTDGTSKKRKSAKSTDRKVDAKEFNLNNFEDLCYQKLLEVSNRFASESELNPTTTIIPLNSLKEMATKLPANKKQFMAISHVTKAFFEKYGIEFMKVIQSCIEMKKNTEQLDQDASLNGSLLVELSDDEFEEFEDFAEPLASTSSAVEPKSKKRRTS